MGFSEHIDKLRKEVWIQIIASRNYDKYQSADFGLNMDINYYGGGLKEAPDRLKERFDLAEQLIAKAESEGLDTKNAEILKHLGDEVRSKMDGMGHKIWNMFKK